MHSWLYTYMWIVSRCACMSFFESKKACCTFGQLRAHVIYLDFLLLFTEFRERIPVMIVEKTFSTLFAQLYVAYSGCWTMCYSYLHSQSAFIILHWSSKLSLDGIISPFAKHCCHIMFMYLKAWYHVVTMRPI